MITPSTPENSSSSPNMRRNLLALGFAGIAGVAGLGASWWKNRQQPLPQNELANFFNASYMSPNGKEMAMKSLLGKPVLLNFWATWCPPCVEEMPLIDEFYQKNVANGFQVLGIAVDKVESVQSFLKKTSVHYPLVVVGSEGLTLTKSMGNLVGALPFSVLVSSSGGILQRRMGKVTDSDLQQWVKLR